jgi:hypothetical protein
MAHSRRHQRVIVLLHRCLDLGHFQARSRAHLGRRARAGSAVALAGLRHPVGDQRHNGQTGNPASSGGDFCDAHASRDGTGGRCRGAGRPASSIAGGRCRWWSSGSSRPLPPVGAQPSSPSTAFVVEGRDVSSSTTPTRRCALQLHPPKPVEFALGACRRGGRWNPLLWRSPAPLPSTAAGHDLLRHHHSSPRSACSTGSSRETTTPARFLSHRGQVRRSVASSSSSSPASNRCAVCQGQRRLRGVEGCRLPGGARSRAT